MSRARRRRRCRGQASMHEGEKEWHALLTCLPLNLCFPPPSIASSPGRVHDRPHALFAAFYSAQAAPRRALPPPRARAAKRLRAAAAAPTAAAAAAPRRRRVGQQVSAQLVERAVPFLKSNFEFDRIRCDVVMAGGGRASLRHAVQVQQLARRRGRLMAPPHPSDTKRTLHCNTHTHTRVHTCG